MLKKIHLKDAVGEILAHDITEIRPGEFKGPAFRKGHTVSETDIELLKKLGKNHLYCLDIEDDEIHEDQAAALLAGALAGNGVIWRNNPKEGKIALFAEMDGLLNVEVATLEEFNMVEEVMCATLHNKTLVRKDDMVAATRAIPLVIKRAAIERAVSIAGLSIVSVKPLLKKDVGLIITGNEIYNGLIEDGFAPVLRKKVEELGSTVSALDIAPDEPRFIARVIRSQMEKGCNLILLTGGMSVDPDDVTREGINMAGVKEVHYGSAVLPGAMFLAAYLENAVLLGVPACALYHKATVLDLVLPRILAGEHIGKKELAAMGHGGLCRNCMECSFPHCSFGKGTLDVLPTNSQSYED